ncbi:hypothetical protein N431DRAFT_125179 [Stipitochalara longipes BDJ]|nr:hypothetical protein N431DRAFT_125179 [Stipitochalara longipes BDJ]
MSKSRVGRTERDCICTVHREPGTHPRHFPTKQEQSSQVPSERGKLPPLQETVDQIRSTDPPPICSQPEKKRRRNKMPMQPAPPTQFPAHSLPRTLLSTTPVQKESPFLRSESTSQRERKLSHYLRNVVFDFL